LPGALILRFGALALLAGAVACERPPEPTAPVPTAVNPSDAFCLEPEILRAEPVALDAVWARWRHWAICDHDAVKAAQYLDILVARDDPNALRFKGESLRRSDPVESDRLLRRAERFGWREPTLQNEINKLATPPP